MRRDEPPAGNRPIGYLLFGYLLFGFVVFGPSGLVQLGPHDLACTFYQ
jgi:hypothetical protein